MTTVGPLQEHRPERIAVVIPAKNEAERLEATIRSARTIVGVDLVVVVDDGSTDSTSAVAQGADALVVRHRSNRGKAAAMATGARLVALREEAERAASGIGAGQTGDAGPRQTPTGETLPGAAQPGETPTGETPAGAAQPGETPTGETPPEADQSPAAPIGPDRAGGAGASHADAARVTDPGAVAPRALLFLDADMTDSAAAAQPLVDAVLVDGVDMAIALLPPQEGAGGMGLVVRTARNGIRRATGWEPTQPLSGTRCITREAWDACQPLAAGWGVETSLTIDALDGGFWVKEIECDLRHRATGNDMKGRLHRAAQLRDVLRALVRRRHVTPETAATVPDANDTVAALDAASTSGAETPPVDPSEQAPSAPTPAAQAPSAPTSATKTPSAPIPSAPTPAAQAPSAQASSAQSPEERSAGAADAGQVRDSAADARRKRLHVLPVAGEFSDDQLRALGDVDAPALADALASLPVSSVFSPDDVVMLAGEDLASLADLMRSADVSEQFAPEHAVVLAAYAARPAPHAPQGVGPLTPDEFVSLVVHEAVEAENRGVCSTHDEKPGGDGSAAAENRGAGSANGASGPGEGRCGAAGPTGESRPENH
ncbi:glycosyltransferase [Brachybacterium timonense]|uniref:glycosyltransferase n=1 Tax=Brachybacterium timonense TaxID=2050896 RepID=UPI003183BBD2